MTFCANLAVPDGRAAIAFYETTFGATARIQAEDPSGAVVARVAVGGSEFWISSGADARRVRLIVITDDPAAVHARALAAGASEVHGVSERYGWTLARFVDPFGHDWEVGHPLP